MHSDDYMQAREVIRKNPEFVRRFLWIRQSMGFLFLVIGVVMVVVQAFRAVGEPAEAGSLGSRLLPVLFPLCWSIFVILLLRDGMAALKSLKEQ